MKLVRLVVLGFSRVLRVGPTRPPRPTPGSRPAPTRTRPPMPHARRMPPPMRPARRTPHPTPQPRTPAAAPRPPPSPAAPPRSSTTSSSRCRARWPPPVRAAAIPDGERNKTSDPILFGGDAATTYRVKLRFCGAVEPRPYRNCQSPMADGRFCPGGEPDSSGSDPDTRPTYELKVSAPARSYLLNNGPVATPRPPRSTTAPSSTSRAARPSPSSTASRGPETLTARSGGPHTCPYVPRIEQPYAGQFIHVVVESVVPPQ